MNRSPFQWFCAGSALTENTEADQSVQVLKYRAELCYYKRQYSEALQHFDQLHGTKCVRKIKLWFPLDISKEQTALRFIICCGGVILAQIEGSIGGSFS